VATYGQVAALAGVPTQPRLAGYALHALTPTTSPAVPWHRVINARGAISLGEFDGAELQRRLLEAEGVVFKPNGCVDLERYRWKSQKAKKPKSQNAETLKR
jgi:methylated-DNA-protein-cysteine methyltransferase-like protein